MPDDDLLDALRLHARSLDRSATPLDLSDVFDARVDDLEPPCGADDPGSSHLVVRLDSRHPDRSSARTGGIRRGVLIASAAAMLLAAIIAATVVTDGDSDDGQRVVAADVDLPEAGNADTQVHIFGEKMPARSVVGSASPDGRSITLAFDLADYEFALECPPESLTLEVGSETDDTVAVFVALQGRELVDGNPVACPLEVTAQLDAPLDGRVVDLLGYGPVEIGGAPAPTPAGAPSEPPMPEDDSPSQSLQDAERDGVHPDLAALPQQHRSERLTVIDADEGFWVLSRAPSEGVFQVGDPEGRYGIDRVLLPEYGEVLLLDRAGRIVRAYPMPGMVPSWIHVGEEGIFAGRVGDGGLPASSLVRIDRRTWEAFVVIFPFGGQDGVPGLGWRTAPDGSSIESFVEVAPVTTTGTEVTSWIGRVAVDLPAIEALVAALVAEEARAAVVPPNGAVEERSP